MLDNFYFSVYEWHALCLLRSSSAEPTEPQRGPRECTYGVLSEERTRILNRPKFIHPKNGQIC